MKIIAFEDEEVDWLLDLLHSLLDDFSDEGPDGRSLILAKSIIFKLGI